MKGSAAQSSHNQLRAAQLAVEQINKQGGVRGYKIKIVGYDLPNGTPEAEESIRKVMKDEHTCYDDAGFTGKSPFDVKNCG